MADGTISPGSGFTIVEAASHDFARLPELGILARTRCAAPAFPLAALGPWWAAWAAQAAEGANAPPDYVALPLLAAASALLGNARWVRAWQGWLEPPVLWCAAIGNPSSGKTPGAAPITRETLGIVEKHMQRGFPDELAAWKEAKQVADGIDAQLSVPPSFSPDRAFENSPVWRGARLSSAL